MRIHENVAVTVCPCPVSPPPRRLCNNRQDGSNATLPHWAKWSESYITDGEAKLKAAYASRLPLLKSLSAEWDPNGMFVNSFFERMFAPTG